MAEEAKQAKKELVKANTDDLEEEKKEPPRVRHNKIQTKEEEEAGEELLEPSSESEQALNASPSKSDRSFGTNSKCAKRRSYQLRSRVERNKETK